MVASVVYAAGSGPSIMVDLFGGVAGAARVAVVPDGQHVALSQLQGFEPRRARARPLIIVLMGVLIYLIWNFSQPVLLACRYQLRLQRHRDPHRRHRAATLTSAPHPPQRNRSIKLAESGTDASRVSRWSAAKPCWPRKCANSGATQARARAWN